MHYSYDRTPMAKHGAADPFKSLVSKAEALAETCQEIISAAQEAAKGDPGGLARVDNLAAKSRMLEGKTNLLLKALKAAAGQEPQKG